MRNQAREEASQSGLWRRGRKQITAEGNVENVFCILERKKNSHIRAHIRIPDDFSYEDNFLLEREIWYSIGFLCKQGAQSLW